MRPYELMMMFSPDYTEAEVKKYTEKIKKFLTDKKATNIKADFWGKRDLAYKIRQFTQAYYVVLTFNGSPSLSPELKEFLKLEEEVFRYLLTIREDEIKKPKKVQAK